MTSRVKTHPDSEATNNNIRWYQETKEGVILKLKVQAGSTESKICGTLEDRSHQLRLKIKLMAPALENRANAELLHFLKKLLNLPLSHLSILRGEKSPLKDILCKGISVIQFQSLKAFPNKS